MSKDAMELAHLRLGHASKQRIIELAKSGAVQGFSLQTISREPADDDICESCLAGNWRKGPLDPGGLSGRESLLRGPSKAKLPEAGRKSARYDRIGLFEDVDFYLQLAREGKAYIKLKRLATSNDSQDYVDIAPERYEDIFRDWADNFPNVTIDWSKPSVFAGNKKIPVTVRFKYNKLVSQSIFDIMGNL
jgi:hypothetical protein